MPKGEVKTEPVEYIDLDKIPKGTRGMKAIPEEWIAVIQKIPNGKALIISDLKYTTVQGRIRKLLQSKRLANENGYKVLQRKSNGKVIVYVAHEE